MISAIPDEYIRASLTDCGMVLKDAGVTGLFLTPERNPVHFAAWADHIRENWIEQPFNEYLRPESESEKETA